MYQTLYGTDVLDNKTAIYFLPTDISASGTSFAEQLFVKTHGISWANLTSTYEQSLAEAKTLCPINELLFILYARQFLTPTEEHPSGSIFFFLPCFEPETKSYDFEKFKIAYTRALLQYAEELAIPVMSKWPLYFVGFNDKTDTIRQFVEEISEYFRCYYCPLTESAVETLTDVDTRNSNMHRWN